MSQNLDLESLALTLFEIGAVQIGEFKLHSGRTSHIYFDLRLLASFPRVLRQVVPAYRALLEKLEFDLLAAAPLAGLPIGTAICLDMDVPLIYPRKTAKGYGTGKMIEGKWGAAETAVVIDDLVTSGDSMIQAITSLESGGLRVTDAVVLIDREQGGADTLRQQGYNLHAVMNLSQLLTILENKGCITLEQRTKIMETL